MKVILTNLAKTTLFGVLASAFTATAIAQTTAQPAASEPAARADVDNPAARRSRGSGGQHVYKAEINPHWFNNNTRFWYRNDLPDGAREFVMEDAEQGQRRPAFDHEKLARALSKASGQEFKADRLPFSEIEYVEEGEALCLEAAGKKWCCQLDNYACAPATGNERKEPSQAPKEEAPPSRHRFEGGAGGRSPDGQWRAFVREQNVYVSSVADGKEIPLSQDGCAGTAYDMLEWASDSKSLVAWRVEAAEIKEVYRIQTSPPGGGRSVLQHGPYALPGDKFPRYELSVFNVVSRRQVKPAVDRFESEWERPHLRWNKDGLHFTYTMVDRGHQRLRVVEVDTQTGSVRNIIDEKTATFIWTAHTENLKLDLVNWLDQTDEIIYVSERDGWRHLYLVDAREGTIKTQITKGQYVVRGIQKIDEGKRQIWFSAGGRDPAQDPYFLHYYRVGFDGTGLVDLTPGNGNHSVQFSPDYRFLIDTYSRVDMPPVHELRRTTDGTLACKLEEADISELKARGWQAPEVFVAKGRDGKTDIWGIICRPHDFDPGKKYPVLEDIYAGPQESYVPKSFSLMEHLYSLADEGYIVVRIDGMGTANRSKAFHDVCWKNLKDAGFEDRILWHKAVAAKYPAYDISRVGIFGGSAGGQNAAGALLFHPEFYKVAVANSGCHDNRMDKASWNEQWMGYPVGPQYAECSNIENAGRLQGRLMLVLGELDNNVPPESTYRFVDALILAGKDFDLLVVPNGGHCAGGAYGDRRLRDFFRRYLAGVEPPNRNATASKAN